MSRHLTCDLNIAGTEGPRYWWPLVCEVVWSYGYTFDSPYAQGRQSSMLPEDEEGREVSFQDLWTYMYRNTGGVTAVFWSKGTPEEALSLDVIMTYDQEQARTGIMLDFPGGSIADVPLEQARQRLAQFAAMAKDLIEACEPQRAHMYWSNSPYEYVPWAAIGVDPDKRDPRINPLVTPAEQPVVRMPWNAKLGLWIQDPVPLMRRGGPWEFVSLLDG